MEHKRTGTSERRPKQANLKEDSQKDLTVKEVNFWNIKAKVMAGNIESAAELIKTGSAKLQDAIPQDNMNKKWNDNSFYDERPEDPSKKKQKSRWIK